MTTDITELAQMKGQKVEAPYYLAECTECGKMYPSSQLIESRNYMDGDADCYCPHCNATDPDIADCGSEGVTAWNYQQARIDALVEALENSESRLHEVAVACATAEQALEKAQQQTTESENRVRKQNRHICELFDDNTALRQRIAELESRTVTVKPMRPGHITVGGEKIGIYMRDEVDEFIAALTAAGIKVEAE
ncbi:TPA: hypothetical protein ACHJKB_000708 [Klebsiella variicola]